MKGCHREECKISVGHKLGPADEVENRVSQLEDPEPIGQAVDESGEGSGQVRSVQCSETYVQKE
jgi:hypothetical protein